MKAKAKSRKAANPLPLFRSREHHEADIYLASAALPLGAVCFTDEGKKTRVTGAYAYYMVRTGSAEEAQYRSEKGEPIEYRKGYLVHDGVEEFFVAAGGLITPQGVSHIRKVK